MDIQDAMFDEDHLKEDRLKVYADRNEEKKKRALKMGTEVNLQEPTKHLYPKTYGGSFGDDLITVNPGKCI